MESPLLVFVALERTAVYILKARHLEQVGSALAVFSIEKSGFKRQ